MSRSRRKTPILGHTTCSSERDDKKRWHRRWRNRERTNLVNASREDFYDHLPVLKNEVSNVWSMGKDGKSYWSTNFQVDTADRIADHTGRSSQEHAARKKRLLHKWRSK